MKIVKKFKETWHDLFKEITVAEYISWWALRILLLYAFIHFTDPNEKIMCGVNMCALYAISLLRLIAPKNSIVGRTSFRCQNIINFFEFIGTFLGNYINVYAYITKYDRLLHILSGAGAVIAGYYIYIAFASKDGKKKCYDPSLTTFFSTAFSFMIICIWEIVEFLGDFVFGTQNQGYRYQPPETDFLIRVFGHGPMEGQSALWDTMMDMIDAAIMTAVSAVVMYIVLRLWNKHIQKKEAAQISEQEEAVSG